MSCESCVYRDKKNLDICKNCSRYEPSKPRFELGKVDIFELARLLKEKEEQKKAKENNNDNYS